MTIIRENASSPNRIGELVTGRSAGDPRTSIDSEMMNAPATPPNVSNIEAWRAFALAYVGAELGDAAPGQLGDFALFERSPIEGEGATVLFRFEADRSGHGVQPYYVAVGRTEPNYYDGGNLSFEEAFSLHLGTRFMLLLGVAQVKDGPESLGPDDQPYDMERDARLIVDRVAPQAPVTDTELAALFDVSGERHAVIRARIAGRDVYIMGRDAPLGFSQRTDLPAPMAYRLHLGEVLRKEPNPDLDERS